MNILKREGDNSDQECNYPVAHTSINCKDTQLTASWTVRNRGVLPHFLSNPHRASMFWFSSAKIHLKKRINGSKGNKLWYLGYYIVKNTTFSMVMDHYQNCNEIGVASY